MKALRQNKRNQIYVNPFYTMTQHNPTDTLQQWLGQLSAASVQGRSQNSSPLVLHERSAIGYWSTHCRPSDISWLLKISAAGYPKISLLVSHIQPGKAPAHCQGSKYSYFPSSGCSWKKSNAKRPAQQAQEYLRCGTEASNSGTSSSHPTCPTQAALKQTPGISS